MKKGFTLVELLIVIGILAVLSAVTILVLNPAQLFAQARDSQRISDLATVSSAINFYISTASTSVEAGSLGADANCYVYNITPAANCRFTGTKTPTGTSGATRVTDGTGWIPVALSESTGGSPISALPVDPVNTAASTYYYAYTSRDSDKVFEINAKMESTRYKNGGSDDRETNDGGSNVNLYEIGNAPGLNL